ncbi:MAG: cytochrome c oxidase subunit 2A [Acidimicrobiales bacterium]
MSASEGDAAASASVDHEEEFKPTGTIFLLGCFIAMLILLWVTVYLILLSRGATG